MSKLMIIAGLVGLSACVAFDPQPAPAVDSGWRTLAGAVLSTAEIEALRQSCAPHQVTVALDPGRPVANPISDNPVYHPGGEGLANAPAIGIAAADRSVEPGTRRVADLAAGPPDECLYRNGLVRIH